jgi:deoxyribonuclease-4
MSVAGGVRFAVERAALHGCEALQIFSRNPNQWQGRPLDAEDVRMFRRRRDETGITPAVSHASYLINLAAAGEPLRSQSIDALTDEIERAHHLGLDGVVLHPGTCTTGTDTEALGRVADALRLALARTRRSRVPVLIEHTAGQGRTLGHRFEHLSFVLAAVDQNDRLGVCLDTCHLVAAGYDIVSEPGYTATLADFERLVGWHRLRVVHANDSKKPCGSRVDRHEHIGEGCLGPATFGRLLRDRRFAGLPFLIETAKTVRPGRPETVVLDPLDQKNLGMLRELRENRDDHG